VRILINFVLLVVRTFFLGRLYSVFNVCSYIFSSLNCRYIDSAGLSGPIPSSFSKLTNMKLLVASDNEFTGRLPDYIGRWSNLQVLRFQGNSFQGPLPATLSNLVNLTDL